MRIAISALGVVCAVSLSAQSRMSWQDLCFKNPSAPPCSGRDFAVKKSNNPAPAPASKNVVRGSGPVTVRSGPTAMVVLGGIDWRFADPYADALVGFNFSGILASPLAKSLVMQLGAKRGLNEADMKRIFDGLSDLDQGALSVRNNRVVILMTGRVTEHSLPPAEPGFKAVQINGNSMLLGHADAVDQALGRLAWKGQANELMSLAEQYQAANEFWILGNPAIAGPAVMRAGLKRFALSVSVRDRLVTDVGYQFATMPTQATLRALDKTGTGTFDGNMLHIRSAMEAAEAQAKIREFAGTAQGEQMASLIEAAKALPIRDASVPKRTRPVIYGLDDGPREVGAGTQQ